MDAASILEDHVRRNRRRSTLVTAPKSLPSLPTSHESYVASIIEPQARLSVPNEAAPVPDPHVSARPRRSVYARRARAPSTINKDSTLTQSAIPISNKFYSDKTSHNMSSSASSPSLPSSSPSKDVDSAVSRQQPNLTEAKEPAESRDNRDGGSGEERNLNARAGLGKEDTSVGNVDDTMQLSTDELELTMTDGVGRVEGGWWEKLKASFTPDAVLYQKRLLELQRQQETEQTMHSRDNKRTNAGTNSSTVDESCLDGMVTRKGVGLPALLLLRAIFPGLTLIRSHASKAADNHTNTTADAADGDDDDGDGDGDHSEEVGGSERRRRRRRSPGVHTLVTSASTASIEAKVGTYALSSGSSYRDMSTLSTSPSSIGGIDGFASFSRASSSAGGGAGGRGGGGGSGDASEAAAGIATTAEVLVHEHPHPLFGLSSFFLFSMGWLYTFAILTLYALYVALLVADVTHPALAAVTVFLALLVFIVELARCDTLLLRMVLFRFDAVYLLGNVIVFAIFMLWYYRIDLLNPDDSTSRFLGVIVYLLQFGVVLLVDASQMPRGLRIVSIIICLSGALSVLVRNRTDSSAQQGEGETHCVVFCFQVKDVALSALVTIIAFVLKHL